MNHLDLPDLVYAQAKRDALVRDLLTERYGGPVIREHKNQPHDTAAEIEARLQALKEDA